MRPEDKYDQIAAEILIECVRQRPDFDICWPQELETLIAAKLREVANNRADPELITDLEKEIAALKKELSDRGPWVSQSMYDHLKADKGK